VKKIYKSKQSESIMMELYDKQLKAYDMPYEDIFVDTRFGKTHVVKIGNPQGKPLLITHGGNYTTPYELTYYSALLPYFCVYAVDTIGHPGKSAQTAVSYKTLEYGNWTSDVITGLGFNRMSCLSGALGVPILLKLMSVAPDKVENAVLIVPAGFADAAVPSGIMAFVGNFLMRHIFAKNDERLKQVLLPMALKEEYITDNKLEMFKLSYKHVVINNYMPDVVDPKDLQNYNSPTMVIVAEHDNMFPSEKTLVNAKKAIKHIKTHVLKGQGNMFVLHEEDITLIKSFLENEY
jgi:pimeloyl-ACP methyl ester carboxylesterase